MKLATSQASGPLLCGLLATLWLAGSLSCQSEASSLSTTQAPVSTSTRAAPLPAPSKPSPPSPLAQHVADVTGHQAASTPAPESVVAAASGPSTSNAPLPRPQTGGQQAKRRQQQQQPAQQADEYLVGLGIADITGPAADVNLMGYAKPDQNAGGIHLRQFSRATLIEDKRGSRLLYIALDNGMVSQLLSMRVLRALKDQYGPQVFNETNVMISASHTHSGPGGYFQYVLYNFPSAGFIRQTLEALLAGVLRSVERAQQSMQPAHILLGQGELLDASINRSPTSYEQNPADERARYKYDTDKTMYLLKFVASRTGEPLGALTWFAVHGTSMNNTNLLISSDNKGYASLLFEEEFNPEGSLPGQGRFVATFAQANEGDVSPNTRGPRCIDTGLPCDAATSTCGDPPRNEKCVAMGPGRDMFESTQIIGYKQYARARQLFQDDSKLEPLSGPIGFTHEYIDMSRQVVPNYRSVMELARRQKPRPLIQPNATYSTCAPAMGYSFAAGTTDGPGAFDFTQASGTGGESPVNQYWSMMRDLLRRPTKEALECHFPKPILLNTGEMDFPSMWSPRIVPTQILRLGHKLAIVGLPGEFTTMAGRRVREAVQRALEARLPARPASLANSPTTGNRGAGADDDDEDDQSAEGEPQMQSECPAPQVTVVLSGLTNVYTSYVTTLEEYENQRYEGASTIYGPHTLQAYVNQFKRLAEALASGQPLANQSHLEPPDLSSGLFTLRPGVFYDGPARGHSFGDLLVDANSSQVYRCRELVNVTFVSSNPRNDLRLEGSFLYVERLYEARMSWQQVVSDASWETKFIWQRTSTLMGESTANIQWAIPHNCRSGVYRVRHLNASKSLMQRLTQFQGISSPFVVWQGPSDSTPADPANNRDLAHLLNMLARLLGQPKTK